MNKVLLLILDGYGLNKAKVGNAIAASRIPNLKRFFKENGISTLDACGNEVGLPKNAMGNSEVGHLNIGAGRVVYQLNTMIDKEIENGKFHSNSCFFKALNQAKEKQSNIHLLGLLSDGNVHSNIDHLFTLLEFFHNNNFNKLFLHAFTDGRDTPPDSGIEFMDRFISRSKKFRNCKVATVCGRYYAMDRDQRWERIQKAYDAIVNGKGQYFTDPLQVLRYNYEQEITDEFIVPAVITKSGKPVVTVQEDDCVIFFNFRADRARQISHAFLFPDYNHFPTQRFSNLRYITFSEYDREFNDKAEVCFRLPKLKNILGEVISNQGLKQLRLAETEKYAHVTFFFNGGREKPFPGEDRILIPSPKIATYDLKPEMSAYQVKEQLTKALTQEKYDLVVTNFANCDMVGHTGDFDATVKAVEAVDKCLGEIFPIARSNQYNIVVTADHGNADKMIDENNNIFTAHSKNPVPFSIAFIDKSKPELKTGKLADIAPTILTIMGIDPPSEMTGKILYRRNNANI